MSNAFHSILHIFLAHLNNCQVPAQFMRRFWIISDRSVPHSTCFILYFRPQWCQLREELECMYIQWPHLPLFHTEKCEPWMPQCKMQHFCSGTNKRKWWIFREMQTNMMILYSANIDITYSLLLLCTDLSCLCVHWLRNCQSRKL